ncbi:MAG: hypothetical protein ABSH13_19490 [Candidatus Acidiferrum sp.]|jgi:hypothetical protein
MKLLGANKSFERIVSLARPVRLLALALSAVVLVALAIAVPLRGRQTVAGAGLTAHEWGTFTAIAGANGQPVEWLPVDLVSKPELPTFVEHFRGVPKNILRGTVRMETPVIYFYSGHETNLSVHVSFSKGFITEWYPHATRLEPSSPIADDALYQPHEDGSIAWDSITVAPDSSASFPRKTAASRYYAARATSATPISVPAPKGDQHEKFLFYRGVSTVALPLSAKVLPSGSILFENLAGQPIPSLIVFERRGDKLGYHIVTAVQDHAILETPAVSGTVDTLRGDLEDILVGQGLFPDEARAMLETWGDSWFEEGSRLIYIVPRAYVDSILPLSIRPAPAKLARVFVGRMELVTPATEKSIEAATASHDGTTLRKYGRFLYPIFDVMLAKQHDPASEDHLWQELGVSLATDSSTTP